MPKYVLGETANYKHNGNYVHGTIVQVLSSKFIVKTQWNKFFTIKKPVSNDQDRQSSRMNARTKPRYKRGSGADLKQGNNKVVAPELKAQMGLSQPKVITSRRTEELSYISRIKQLEAEVARLTSLVQRLESSSTCSSIATQPLESSSAIENSSQQSHTASKRREKRKLYRQRQRQRVKDLKESFKRNFVPTTSSSATDFSAVPPPPSLGLNQLDVNTTRSTNSDDSTLSWSMRSSEETSISVGIKDRRYYRAIHLLQGKTQLYLIFQYLKILRSCDGRHCHHCTAALVELLNLDIVPEREEDVDIIYDHLYNRFSFCDLPNEALSPRFHNITPVKGLCRSYLKGSNRDIPSSGTQPDINRRPSTV